ncbi:hypothetical protein PMAYCL1PPCAC_28363, partial [Pristionchus mayeri]
QFVLDAAETLIMYQSRWTKSKKLFISDLFGLDQLQTHVIQSFAKVSEIKALEFDSFYRDCSESIKARVGYRTIELLPND